MPCKPDVLISYIGEQIESLKANLDYKLKAFVDEKRIANAKTQLQTATGLSNIFFAPLDLGSNKLTYQLNLPTGLTTRSSVNASILMSLATIDDILEFDNIEDFKNVYERLSSVDNREGILTGKVDLSLEHFSIPYIPVTIRLNNMVGQIFNIEQTFDKTLQVHHITLTNLIESSVSFKNLTAKIQIGDFEWAANTIGLTIPEQLATGSSLKFDVVLPPNAVLNVANLETAKISFEWANLKVILNKEVLYKAMLGDYNKLQPYQKTIQVSFLGINTSIGAIQIKFKSTQNTTQLLGHATFLRNTFAADNLKMTLKPPIQDYILNKEATYFYQLLVVDKDGKEFLGDWEDYLEGDLLVTSAKINPILAKTLQGALI
jgi:hypothetical protein